MIYVLAVWAGILLTSVALFVSIRILLEVVKQILARGNRPWWF